MKRLITILLLIFPALVNAQNLDIDILKSINPHEPTSAYWNVTSSSAYFIPATAAVGTIVYSIVKKDRHSRENAYELLISIGAGSLVSQSIKYAINRQRPAEKYADDIHPAQVKYGRSFPSGHTTLAFATATTLSLQYKKWYIVIPSYLWAASVAYSRMYRGLHYPSDVLGGAIVGIGSGILSHWLTQKLIHHKMQ